MGTMRSPVDMNKPTAWEEHIARTAVQAASTTFQAMLTRATGEITAALAAPVKTRSVADPTKDTGSEDVRALHTLTGPYPAYAWPLVAALAALAPLVRFTDLDVQALMTNGMLPWPVLGAAPTAGVQATEKGAVHPTVIHAANGPADLHTMAAYTDVALQGLDPAGLVEAAVHQLLDLAVCAGVEAAWSTTLDTAAGAAAKDLGAAVEAVATAWPGPLAIITPVGTADLQASGYPLIVSPTAKATTVVALLGLGGLVVGPVRQAAWVPSLLGRDLASAVFYSTLSVGTGAVAKVA